MFTAERFPFNRLSDRSIERIVKVIHKRSGLTVNVFAHLLRHTKASDLANSGTSIQIIAEILGRDNISTSQIYAKVSKENILHEFKRTS